MSYLGSDDLFVTGINYWPRSSAMYAWERFDADEWAEDFARIAALGLDVVRFFLLWEHFQPAADSVSGQALEQLVRVMDALHAHGLRGMPTFFCGHMSGVNWLPEWSLDPTTPSPRFRTLAQGKERPYGIGDFYGDARLLAAQELQCKRVAERLHGHPALACWDLGNEFSNLRAPSSAHAAAEWSRRLCAALREFSDAPVTAGNHGEDISEDRHIRPSSLCAPFGFGTMHGYSVYAPYSRGRLDTDVVPFNSEILHTFSDKPVLFSEYGNPTCPPSQHAKNDTAYECLSEEEMVRYGAEVFEKLHAGGALGAMWWCYADYDPALASLPPFDRAKHELHFGIIRADGTEKPIARGLAELAAGRRRIVTPRRISVEEESYYRELPESMNAAYAEYTSRRSRTPAG